MDSVCVLARVRSGPEVHECLRLRERADRSSDILKAWRSGVGLGVCVQ